MCKIIRILHIQLIDSSKMYTVSMAFSIIFVNDTGSQN